MAILSLGQVKINNNGRIKQIFIFCLIFRGVCDIIGSVIGNGCGDQVQILDKAVCISNNHGKSMNPTILPPAMDK